MSIAANLEKLYASLPPHAKLVAVSKFKPVSDILDAHSAGQKVFGENRVQELTDKQPQLPADIEWHMIGHLQTNKVKYITPFVHMIHGVDSFKLLKEIDKQAAKAGRVQNCLLQVHIAQEETKFGFNEAEIEEMLNSTEFANMKNVTICGLMGMATLTDNTNQIRNEFRGLKQLHDRLKSRYFSTYPEFKELSMGMSGDYQIAIEEGSTMVRVGSAIFGER